MIYNIKGGVDVRFLRWELTRYLFQISEIFRWNAKNECDDFPFTITAGADGTHMQGSKHYKDQAIDMRFWFTNDRGERQDLSGSTVENIAKDLRRLLGSDYQTVVHEFSHVHLEWDP